VASPKLSDIWVTFDDPMRRTLALLAAVAVLAWLAGPATAAPTAGTLGLEIRVSDAERRIAVLEARVAVLRYRLRVQAGFTRWNDRVNIRQQRRIENLQRDSVAFQSQLAEAIYLAYYVLPECLAEPDRHEADCLAEHEINYQD
jgi:hypothetical protein